MALRKLLKVLFLGEIKKWVEAPRPVKLWLGIISGFVLGFFFSIWLLLVVCIFKENHFPPYLPVFANKSQWWARLELRAEWGMTFSQRPQTIIFCSTPLIIVLIIASYLQKKKSTFGLKLEILRSCREEIFLKLHFLLQEVLIFFLSEDKMIMCLTIRGEEINP